MEKTWWVYILLCGDGTYYTGVTTDVAARLETHRSGSGAKYTRSRGPLQLAYCEKCADKVAAFQREYAIKQLKRSEKAALCQKWYEENNPRS